MEKITVPVRGMHCRSCEIVIEENLSAVPQVKKSVVQYKKGVAEVYYSGRKPNMSKIEDAIREAGYVIGTKGKSPWLSRQASDWRDVGVAAIIFLFVYLAFKNAGIESWTPTSEAATDPSGLGVVFLVGLTAGLSTCLALVGGLVLGVSARYAETHPEASALQKFRPHLFFNVGRVIGYAVLGGMLGWLGSLLQFSSGFLGGLTILVSGVMLVLGVKLLGIFPAMDTVSVTLPKSIAKILGINQHAKREYSHRGAFILGLLTFFLPCGFTQSMQLFAVSSGNFLSGALIMGVFALGTTPGLLGIGGLASSVRGAFARRFFVLAGLIVIAFAIFNITNGLRLLGFDVAALRSQSTQTVEGSKNAAATTSTEQQKKESLPPAGDFQTISMTESSRGYSPNTFTVRKDVPVQWIIDAREPYGCASSIVSPAFDIQKNLAKGENVIEFTPKKTGTFSFSCSMGMYTGTITVVE